MSALGGMWTLQQRAPQNTMNALKVPAFAIIAMGATLVSACTYGAETLPRCFTEKIEPSLRAVKQVQDGGAYRGGDVQLQHTFCSTHDDRLAVAERLLAAGGRSFERHIAEVGSCTHVRLKSAFTPEALQNQVTALCGIAAAARVAYTDWSAGIGDHFLFVSGEYISFTGRGELPKGLKPASR